MKRALPTAYCVLWLLTSLAASAGPPAIEPGLHVHTAPLRAGGHASSAPSGKVVAADTMEPGGAALLFAALACIGALATRRRCIAARLAASQAFMTRAGAP